MTAASDIVQLETRYGRMLALAAADADQGRLMRRWAVIAAMALAWATGAVAAPRFAPHPTRAEVGASLARYGARPTVGALVRQGRWDYVSERIDSGETAWVALAPKLAAGADAGAAEDLPIALAFALPRNAPAVLAAIRTGAFDAEEVCDAPFIEDTVSDIPAWRQKAAAAVARVADPKLAAVKAACLAAIAKPD